ncbi:MAG TPA: extracellular solute-binding protein [Kofleriaceae bacterium]|nr:extracellular solute-binding protein [Kofleriaceae bacterium]
MSPRVLASLAAAGMCTLALAATALSGCAQGGGEAVTLWHAYGGDERAALEDVVATWNHDHPERTVRLVAVPYDAFADKITSAIPNGNGPDLFVYPHDRIGDWVASGLLEPIEFWIDEPTATRYARAPLAAMAYRGSLWGLPLAMKSLALYVRTDLVATPPRTTDELFAMAPALRARGVFPLAYPVDDLYGHAPWLHGFGGQTLDDDGAARIATPEAAAAAAFARDLVVRGVVPRDADAALTATLFNEGKAAMAMSGPWFQGDIEDGVPWRVTTLPVVSATGRAAAPFLGADGVLMSARARDKDAAIAVMLALAGDASATVRATRARQLVPNRAAYDGALAADPVLSGFRGQLEQTVSMPAVPLMRSVWTPYKNALASVVAGAASPADALDRAAGEIRAYGEAPR